MMKCFWNLWFWIPSCFVLQKTPPNLAIKLRVLAHRIYVRYIYLHLVDFCGKCRWTYTIHGSYGSWPQKLRIMVMWVKTGKNPTVSTLLPRWKGGGFFGVHLKKGPAFWRNNIGGQLLKWWVSPTNPWVFPTKNDQHLGCGDWGGNPPFKETPNIVAQLYQFFGVCIVDNFNPHKLSTIQKNMTVIISLTILSSTKISF